MMTPPPPPPLSRCNALELSTVTKRGKKHSLVAYGMDRLPDEILIVILSCVNLKEAVRTSIISRREVKRSMDRIGLTSLTSLRLVHVNVKDEMIEYLLSSCRHLEHLCIKFDNYMKKLNVLSPSLKSLSIFYCTKLKSLTISAANLLSFVYGEASMTPVLKLQLQNVPLLSELQLRGPHCGSFLFEHSEHSKYSHQLQRLVLDVPMLDVVSAPRYDHSLFGLPQLRSQTAGFDSSCKGW